VSVPRRVHPTNGVSGTRPRVAGADEVKRVAFERAAMELAQRLCPFVEV
jgi:hypothetical protein